MATHQRCSDVLSNDSDDEYELAQEELNPIDSADKPPNAEFSLASGDADAPEKIMSKECNASAAAITEVPGSDIEVPGSDPEPLAEQTPDLPDEEIDRNLDSNPDTAEEDKKDLSDSECSDKGTEEPELDEATKKQEALKSRQEKEDLLSEQQKEELKDEAQSLKAEGNTQFRDQLYVEAKESYTKALELCPLCYARERSIMFSNRAACHQHLPEANDAVISDCTEAITLHPHYVKALKRRAETYLKMEKLDEALADYTKILELEPTNTDARQACLRLPGQINERNEKLKTEMLGKLKDLGNLVLKPFGLSTNNFNFVQNESGGYSVNFQNS